MHSSNFVPSAPEPIDPTTFPKWVGKFRILQEVGSGGFASVYFARAEGTDQPVALKVLRQNLDETIRAQVRARFLAEKNIANAVGHPAVVKILEASEPDDPSPYIAMEFVEGRPFGAHCRAAFDALAEETAESFPIWLHEVARLSHQIATAMAQAHRRNIVHRDLKPDNVLVTWDSGDSRRAGVKILDFGIAKAPIKLFPVRQSSTFTRYWTDLGTVMGSPPYMAPEQDGAAHAVTGKADVYALGVMLLLAVTGIDDRDVEMGEMVVDLPGDLEPLLARRPTLPENWARLLRTMVALEPSARPSMGEAARVLQRLAQPNSAFANAVSEWLECGRIPRASKLVRFMAWAEDAQPLTDDELLFLKRAPVAKLRSFRWAAGLGVAATILAASSGLLAWSVNSQRQSLRAYEARLDAAEHTHAREIESLEQERRSELEAQRRTATNSGTEAALVSSLSDQLLRTESQLNEATWKLKDNASRLAKSQLALEAGRVREQRISQERDDQQRRLDRATADLRETRNEALDADRRATTFSQQLAARQQELAESTERLGMCNRALRQSRTPTGDGVEADPRAQIGGLDQVPPEG